VEIREHYKRDGRILPAKTGVFLTLKQWKKLLEYAPEITKAIDANQEP